MKHTITALTGALAFAAGAAHAQQAIVIGHTLSPDSHYAKGAEAFAATLEELSDGAFAAEQAPAGQLGGERDMI